MSLFAACCWPELPLSCFPAIPPCPGLVSPSNSCELVSGVTSDRVQRSWDTGRCQLHVMSVLQRIISRGDHHVITSVTRPRPHLVDGERLNCQEIESVSTVKLVLIFFSMIVKVKGLLSMVLPWVNHRLNYEITKVRQRDIWHNQVSNVNASPRRDSLFLCMKYYTLPRVCGDSCDINFFQMSRK